MKNNHEKIKLLYKKLWQKEIENFLLHLVEAGSTCINSDNLVRNIKNEHRVKHTLEALVLEVDLTKELLLGAGKVG